MLQDKTPDKQDTWEFLERRVEEAIFINKLFEQRDGSTFELKNAVSTAFVTVIFLESPFVCVVISNIISYSF